MFFGRKEKLDLNLLHAVFESQKKTLLEKGYPSLLNISPEDFNGQLENLWKSFAEQIKNIKITVKGNMPLLLVVSHGDLQKKIQKIGGHSELDFSKINNNGPAAENKFYILLDIEDGSKMVARSSKEALKKFKKENRSALNLAESIALLTYFPGLLKKHYFIVADSFYNKGNDFFPLLWLLNDNKNPELHYAWPDIAHGSYGAGSSAIKIKQY